MRILAVDPGLTRCGVGIIDAGPGRSVASVDVFVVHTHASAPLSERLRDITQGIERAISTYHPHLVALERVFAQHNVRTVMGTAQASGVVLAQAGLANVPVVLHTPSEVKAAVSGNGRATKAQVAYAVRQILNLPEGKLLPDATDALALAVCAAWRGGATVGATSPPTPAQQKWRDAERLAQRRRSRS